MSFGERRKHLGPAVEVDHRGDIGRPELLHEPDGRLLGRGERLFHAGAGVDEERQRQLHVRLAEERELLRPPFLEHGEIGEVEIRDVLLGSVSDSDGQQDDVDAGAETDARAARGLCEDRRPFEGNGRDEGERNTESQDPYS